IVTPGGAKAKAELMEDAVVFRGDIKQEVGFEEITAEARGSLLVLSFRGKTVELSAGAKAGALAAKIRSPPSRLDRLGIEYGISAAVAGPLEPGFKAELATRAVVAAGTPKEPVQLLVLGAEPVPTSMLANLPKLMPFVAAGGTVLVVVPANTPDLPASKVQAAARAAGLKENGSARFSPTHAAHRFTKGDA
ncbi:MAG TPA: hypothetical protein VJ874_07260, partial [Candidatus Thermoplasmatota archaeon]|nr:hypothetical protein [Candidatus Thermoplasmatota archaeon]